MRGESRRMTKKNYERENFAKKIVHTEQPRKNSCIDLPKYFTEILVMRTREQIGVKNFCSQKHAFFPGFCLERMFIQKDILTN